MLGKASAKVDVSKFAIAPRELEAILDAHIVGQTAAKRMVATAVAAHYGRLKAEIIEGVTKHPTKSNVLLIGPSGTGKTTLVRTVAEYLEVPYLQVDASIYTSAGYHGADLEEIPGKLFSAANRSTARAEAGIVFIDEIDKVRANQEMGKDVGGAAVQEQLLTMIEGRETDSIHTKNVLFIFSGAFEGIAEITNRRLQKGTIGFAGEPKEKKRMRVMPSTEDFIKYGFNRQFIARIPRRTMLELLTVEELTSILELPESALIQTKAREFRGYGIQLEFDPDAYRPIAERAHKIGSGGRALQEVLDTILEPFFHDLPSTDIPVFRVTREVVENPTAVLEKLLAQYPIKERAPVIAIETVVREPAERELPPYIAELAALGVMETYHTSAARYGLRHGIPAEEIPARIAALREEVSGYLTKLSAKLRRNIGITPEVFDKTIIAGLDLSAGAENFLYQRVGKYLEGAKLKGRKGIVISGDALLNPSGFVRSITGKS